MAINFISQKTGFDRKTIISSLTIALVLAIGGWVFNNASLPKDAKAVQNVDNKVSALLSKDSVKSIKLEIMNYRIESAQNAIGDLKTDVKEVKKGQDEIIRMLYNMQRNQYRGLTSK